MRRVIAGLCSMMAALALVGAVGAGEMAQPGPAAACPDDLTDPDLPIQVEAGQQFVIVLESNRTTGYSWAIGEQPDPAVAVQVSDEYVSGSSGLPGAGGHECWVFEAIGAGETAIGMMYRRPFDPPGTAPGRTATFIIDVSQTSDSPAPAPVPSPPAGPDKLFHRGERGVFVRPARSAPLRFYAVNVDDGRHALVRQL